MITIKTPEEIALMREGGIILRRVADTVAEAAKEGTRLSDLDTLARDCITQAGGTPSFLGYKAEWAKKPYPAAICTSVNEVIVHGIPNNYALKTGDILKIDVGLKYKGWHTDVTVTVGIGTITKEANYLIKAARDALTLAIDQCYPNKTVGDIGFAIKSYIRKQGLYVPKNLSGHGIGKKLHEEPTIFNEGRPDTGYKLREGMVLAIEPMVAVGTNEVVELPDGSFITQDKSLSAEFEDTVAITAQGPIVLTKKTL